LKPCVTSWKFAGSIPDYVIRILTCICLMAGVPNEMTFNTTSTVMTSQRDNTMRHDYALPVTCHSRCASHRTMHMSYRSKTYTWNDVILVKRSMIRVFSSTQRPAEKSTRGISWRGKGGLCVGATILPFSCVVCL